MTFKVGDLAVVFKKTSCCNMGDVGTVVKIKGVIRLHTGACVFCDDTTPEDVAATNVGRMYPVDRLKKIDPPAEGETREAYKNLKVPA